MCAGLSRPTVASSIAKINYYRGKKKKKKGGTGEPGGRTWRDLLTGVSGWMGPLGRMGPLGLHEEKIPGCYSIIAHFDPIQANIGPESESL